MGKIRKTAPKETPKENPFVTWLNEQNALDLSYTLKCSTTAIYSWRKRESNPRPEYLKQLLELGRGRFSLDDIYLKH